MEAQYLFGEDGSETVTELAVVEPDKPPLRGMLLNWQINAQANVCTENCQLLNGMKTMGRVTKLV